MKTEVKGYTLRLGAVYAEFDSEILIETVWAYTGLRADYFCVLDYESAIEVFDILGSVRYDVPMDMFFDPLAASLEETEGDDEVSGEPAEAAREENTTEEHEDYGKHESIDLKAGMQIINGEKALQLLRYRNYANGNFDRMAVQMDFLKEVLSQNMVMRNFMRAGEIYEKVKESVVETNMDARSFENYAETMFMLSEFTFREIMYPGMIRNELGTLFFVPDVKSAVNRYMEFRKTWDDDGN
jgi:anionic cell wall polymer biosynthesis LytR-Cps2A-Psr (LCP) family protein